MKSNQVSVLVVLLLCLVMGGFLYVVDRSSDDEKGWNPSELYSELGARSYEGSSFSDVTFSGGASSDGVAVSMRNGSFSLRTRARHTSSPNSLVANGVPEKSADFWGALSPNSPIASSPNSLIGHMTSSAEYHSFGGGHSGNMGSAMTGMTNSGNVAASFAYSSPSYGVASSGLSSYSPITLSSGTDGTQIMSAEQALISTSNSASGLFGSALQNTYGTASYDKTVYGSNGSTPNGVRGRQNASGEDDEPWFGKAWWQWLDWQYNEDGSNYTGGYGTYKDGTWYFSHQDAYAAYEAWCDYMVSKGMVNYEDLPTLDDWMNWFMQSKGNAYSGTYGTYEFVPLGNILPLVLMALIYMIVLFVKRNKTAQL